MSDEMLLRIVNSPTTLENIHESVYRVSAILDMVRYLLSENTPPQVVLCLISAAEALPSRRDELTKAGTFANPSPSPATESEPS